MHLGPPKVSEISLETPSGRQIYLRRKRLAGERPRPAVLFVHGATYPAHSTFDLPLAGTSWMDDLAMGELDIFAVDLPGYGRAGLLPAMRESPHRSPPLLRTHEAIEDLRFTLDHMLACTASATVSLIGWSWGATLMAALAAACPDRIERLVLHAPQNVRPPQQRDTLPAYRVVKDTDGLRRWLDAIPQTDQDAAAPPEWRKQWLAANFLTLTGASEARCTMAPNGVLQDNIDLWCQGQWPYDPECIEAPTLVVVGEWDRDTPVAHAISTFVALKNAREKRLLCIGRGSHMMMLESSRSVLFEETRRFLLTQ